MKTPPSAFISKQLASLGLDAVGRPRSLFLYDGGAALCKELQIPVDLSTAYYITISSTSPDVAASPTIIVHQQSSSILHMFAHMGFPYASLLPLLLAIPLVIRDGCYRVFARNRGTIWKMVKRVTGMGDTAMDAVWEKLVGLPNEEDIPLSWGLKEKKQL